MNLALTDNNISRQYINFNFRELFKAKSNIRPNHNLIPMMHSLNHVVSRKVNYNTKEHSDGRVLKFDKTFERYLAEVEEITRLDIPKEQKSLIKHDIDSHEYSRLTSDESKIRRKAFGRIKNELILDWESHRKIKWPTYQQDKIYNGKIIRHKGNKFDAHELILNSWGSPHQWYNLMPCESPEHQNILHGKNGMANKIFGN